MPILVLPLAGRGQGFAQDTTARLYYAAKIWGYLKYFNPNVDGCNKNLDSNLIALIPEIENDSSNSLFNASLLKIFAYAGPMPTASVPPPLLTPDQTINLNLSWQYDTSLSPEVQALLDSIRVNFRPAQSCYYESSPYNPPYVINENDYPLPLASTEPYRLLTLFRVWNMYDYFYPYKTLLDQPWDSTLMEMIPIIQAARTTLAFQLALMEFQAQLQDAHAFTNSDTLASHFGYHYFPMVFSYIDSQTVITKVFHGVTAVKVGDVVLSINGMPTQTIRDSLRKYTPGGNPSVINRYISESLLKGQSSLAQTLLVDDGTGSRMVSVGRTSNVNEVGDSIYNWQGDGSHWKILPGNIGYVNMGIANSADIEEMFPSLRNSPAIIFDMRNYPQNFLIYQLCDSLMPNSVPFAKWFFPDPTYPGTGQTAVTNCGPISSNPNYYKGKVIMLVNEVTQSEAEYFAMAISKAPKAIIVGSQTAGANGNTDYTTYPTEITAYYTSWGISFSDGRQTQRIGLVPNIPVRPTIADIRAGIDPVLDTAIILAGGKLGVQPPSRASELATAYPNPFSQSTTISFTPEAAGYVDVRVVNLLGVEVAHLFSGTLPAGEHSFGWNAGGLAPGMYECVVRMNGQVQRIPIIYSR